MSRALLLLLIAAAGWLPKHPSVVAAQNSSVPGVEAQRLRLGLDSMFISVVRGRDTIPTGMLWDDLRLVDEGGSSVLQRVYRSQDRILGTRVDTLVDQSNSLLALRHRSRTDRSHEFLNFSSGRAVGWVRLANGDSSIVDIAIPPAVYNGSSFDLVIRSSPLAEGWSTETPVFVASSRSMVPIQARLVGQEVVSGEHCWRVEADFGGMAVTFWIHEQTRDLWQQVMHVSPDVHILFQRAVPKARSPIQGRAA
jgi:hypothetical protein